jgi:serine/threonine protein kinase
MSERGFANDVLSETHPPAAAPARRGERSTTALPPGARVNEFEILGTLGEGGFGIVYRARDHSLGRVVALKEYMPTTLARRSDTQRVTVKSGDHVQTFLAGMRSFINEARILAQFEHPALVKVHRFCEANGTAYMAMPLYEGVTLKQALQTRAAGGGARPDEAWLRALIEPLLDTLELLHRSSCLHRDIAPDNILLLGGDAASPQPLLLDFGAARRVIGEQTQALTVILKPGYAPLEQYDETAGLRQGPWTDIHALAAVLHYAITGKPPPQAVGRLLQDSYEPLVGLPGRLGRYGDQFLAAIDRGLAPLPQDRPQDVATWRTLLGVRRPVAGRVESMHSQRFQPVPSPTPTQEPPPAVTRVRARRRVVLLGLICCAVAVAVVLATAAHRKVAPAATPSGHHIEVPPKVDEPVAVSGGGSRPGLPDDGAKPGDDADSVAGTPNWVHESLREARQCLVAKRYACTIERAEEVLKSVPAHPLALRLARLGREGAQGAPAGGRKKP